MTTTQDFSTSHEFTHMIFEHRDELLSRARSLFKGNDYEAEDLVQDTIVKALKNEDKFERGTNLKGWLVTIQFRLFVNRYRRSKRLSEIKELHPSYTKPFNTENALCEGSQTVASEKEVERISSLLQKNLDHKYWSVLYIVDIESQSYQDAADLLSIPIGTVMSRLFRARRYAREILRDHYDPTILEACLR